MRLDSFDKFEEEIIIKSYRIKDEKVLQKHNIIPFILLKIQDILRSKFSDKDLNIEKAYNLLKNSIIKMNFQKSLNFVDLFMVNSLDKSKDNITNFSFDYYILKRNDSKNKI